MTPEIKPIIRRVLARKTNCESMRELVTRVDASNNTNQLQLLEPSQQIIETKEVNVSFGEHFENAVIGFVDKVDAIIKRHHDWNEESIALGLISDEEKLRTLKRDLYCQVRRNNPDTLKIGYLTDAIELLEEIKQAEFDRKQEQIKLNLTLPVQINQSLNVFLVFGLLAVIGSYVASYTCGNSRSQFCSNARVIPTQVELFFKD